VVLTPSHMHSVQNESDASTLTVLRGSEKIKPHEELQSIISQLEEGNRCNVMLCSGNHDN
jgi:hypothetical protein